MNFSGFTKSLSGNTIKFSNTTPVDSIERIQFYRDNAVGIFLKKEFRWSFNKEHWSSWNILSQESISSIPINKNKWFFLEVVYTYSSSSTATCSSFSIEYIPNAGSTIIPSIQYDVTPGVVNIIKTEISDSGLLNGKPGNYYLSRTNHTGSQPIGSISGLEDLLKQGALGFTPENIANKSTDGTLSTNSDILYPSEKAVKTYVDTKQSSIGFTPENVANKVNAFQVTPDDTHYPTEKLTKDQLDTKVDKVTGKGLSTEDYTTTEKNKLAGIAAGANVGVVPNAAIVGATKTKITYDSKGLVTSGADATTADIAASTDKNYVTDAQAVVIGNTSSTNSGDNATNSQYSGLTASKQYYHGVLARPVGATNPLPTILTTTTFTLGATANPITYYYLGTPITVNTDKTATLDDGAGGSTAGAYYVYFNAATGNILATKTFPGISITSNILIASVFWNGVDMGLISDERHGYSRDHSWHIWAHNTIGTRYRSGITLTHNGGTGVAATFATTAGEIADEDIQFVINASSAFPTPNTCRLWWQTSATTYTFDTTLSTVPFKIGANGRPVVINSTGYAVTQVPSAANRYVNFFVYAATSLHTPIYIFTETVTNTIAGQGGYTSLANARAVGFPNLSTFGLTAELKAIYRLIVRADGVLQAIDLINDDYRTVNSLPQAAGTVSTTAGAVSYVPTAPLTQLTVQTALDEVAGLLGGTVNIAYNTSIPFTVGNAIMDDADITADTTFTPNSVAAVKGAKVQLRITYGSSNKIILFTGFKQTADSCPIYAVVGAAQLIDFRYDGTDYWVKVSNENTNLALKSEVLTLTNTTAFTPTANYHPTPKSWVESTIMQAIANYYPGSPTGSGVDLGYYGIQWNENYVNTGCKRTGTLASYVGGGYYNESGYILATRPNSNVPEQFLFIHNRLKRCVFTDAGAVNYYLDRNNSYNKDGVLPTIIGTTTSAAANKVICTGLFTSAEAAYVGKFVHNTTSGKTNKYALITAKDSNNQLSIDCAVNNVASPTFFDSGDTFEVCTAILDGTDGQVMVEIPKFFQRYSYSAGIHTLDISLYPYSGFDVHPAFVEGVTTKEFIYFGAFEGFNISTKLGSIPTKVPTTSLTRAQFRVNASNRSASFMQESFWYRSALQTLFHIEYADLNSQMRLNGYTEMSVYADSKRRKTGRTLISGNNNASVYADTTYDADIINDVGWLEHKCVANSYRGVENPYGHIWKFYDGANFLDRAIYVTNIRANFADDTASGYNALGLSLPIDGYIKTVHQIAGAFLPKTIGGSSNTYLPDYVYTNIGWRVSFSGGALHNGANAGFASLYVTPASSSANSSFGARLCF